MFTLTIFSGQPSQAYIAGAQTITVDGRLFTSPTSDSPLLDSSVVFNVKILAADSSCILYEEKQTIDTSQTDGRFTVNVGSMTGATKRTGADVNNPMVSIFQNNSPIAGSCGSYTPAAGDVRYIRITVAPSTTGTVEVLSPDTIIDTVPNALVAETLQGLDRDHVLAIDSTSTLSQANVANIFSSSNYPVLTSLLGGTNSSYVKSSVNGAQIPTVAGVPASLATGQIWFNSSANAFQYYNGSAVQSLGIAGSGIAALTVGPNLTANGTAGGTLNASGTIDLANNATAGTYTKVTVNSKGLVTNGSGLTEADIPTLSTPGHVIGDAITSGTIGGSTAFYSSGNITTTGNVSGTNITSNTATTRAIRLFDPAAGSTNKITITAPTLTADYALVFPNSAGAAGNVLTTDGSGNLSWTSASAGSVTSVGLALPSIFTVTNPVVTSTGTLSATLASQNANLIFAGPSSGSASSPTFRALTAADLPVGGYDSTYLKPALALGKIWVGSSAGVATPVTPSGDLTLSTSGLFTVTALQGSAVDTTAPSAAGQVLRWTSGSKWSPAYLSMQDIHSTVTVGNTIFPVTACTADKTLTWTSLTDTFTCQSIAISDSQITYSSRSAGLIFAGPATGSAAAPTFRSIASTDLPANAYDNTYFKQGGNTFGAAAVLGTSDSNTLTVKTNNVARETFGIDGRIGIGTVSPTAGALVEYFGTGTSQSALLLPRDSTANRPTGVNGMIRYNNVLNKLEVFENNGWTNYASSSAAAASGVVGAVQFSGGSGAFSSDASNLFYDSTNKRLGIGTATPLYPLDIVGTGHFSGAVSAAVVYATLGESHFANTGYSDPVVGSAFDVKIGGTNSLAVRGNAVFVSPVGVGTATAGAILDVYSTGTNSALIVPRASAAARPAGTNGMIRYNTDNNVLESFIGGSWSSLATAAVSGGYLPLAGGTMTGPILYSSGSVGAPSLAFSSDSTTGIYSPSAANLTAVTGGAARMTVNNNGVGIGTTNPNYPLQIASSTSPQFVIQSSGANNGNISIDNTAGGNQTSLSFLDSGTTKWQIGKQLNNTFFMYDNANTRDFLEVASGNIWLNPVGGNISIGTTSASTKLTVYGSAQSLATFVSNAIDTQLVLQNTTAAGKTWKLGHAGTGSGASPGSLYFQNATDGLIPFSISSNGRVGLGTINANANAVLDIVATGATSAVLLPRDSIANRPSGINGMIRYNTDNNVLESFANNSWVSLATATAGGYLPLAGGTMTGAIVNTNGSSGAPSLAFADATTGFYSTGSGNISASTGGSARMTIGSSGNVSIGTTTSSARLVVAGTDTASTTSAFSVLNSSATNLLNVYDNGSVAIGGGSFNSSKSLTVNGGLQVATGSLQISAAGPSSANSGSFSFTDSTGNLNYSSSGGSQGHITFNPTGLVGIGTTTPASLLNVNGNIQAGGTVGNLSSYLGSASGASALGFSTGYLGFNASRTSGNWSLASDGAHNGGNAIFSTINGYLYLAALPNSGTSTAAQTLTDAQVMANVAVTVAPNGLVGIGNQNPAALLDLASSGTNSAIIVPRASTAMRPTSVNGMIRYNTDNSALESYIAGSWVNLSTSAAGGGASQWTTSGSNIYYSSGNVGIGTSTFPFKLTLGGDGGVLASGVYGTGASLGTLGANTSMIWYPRKASFRAGTATGSAFDDSNIGSYSIAAGSDVVASGNNSTAFGGLNSATGTGATAIGFSSTASNQYATAIGGGNSASGTGSTSIGYYTNSPAYGETVVGQFNSTTGSETANSIVSTDPVFVVGNGTTSSARSSALTVLHNGYLGVGVSAPSTVMQIHDPLTATPGGIVIDASSSGGNNSPRIGFIDTALGTTTTAPVWFFDQSADKFRVFRQPNISTVGAAFFTISNTGKIGVGTATANAQLDIYGVGTSASAMLVPRDSSANRPAGVNGMIRYNTDLGALEMYGSGAWSSFAASTGTTGAFLNGGNSFGAAANLGTNDSNVLNFKTNGSTRAVIDASGNFGIGTTSPGAPFQIGSSGATGSVRYVSNGANSYFGIYDSNNSLYYGLGTTLPSPSGTATIAGYYKGLGIGGSTNGAGNPIFGVLTSSQSGSGIGSAALTVKDTNEIDTYYNVLDNGSGSMGIGTSTATNKLNVWGSSNYGIVEIVGNGTNVETSIGFRSSNISKGANAGDWILGANTNGQSTNSFGLFSGGTNSTVLTVLSSGNVGIGTTAPITPLQVSGTALFGYTSANQLNVTVGGGGPSNTRNLALYYISGGTNGSVTGDYSVIQSGYSGIGYSPIALSPAGGGVGIGTTAPSGQLHVNLTTSGSSILQTLTNSGNGSSITIDSAGASGAYFPTAVVGDSVIRAETNSLELGVTSASGHIALGNTSSEWMRISSSGNVGIGSTNPGQKLSVGGTIESTSGGVKFPDGTTQTTASGGAIAMRYYAGSASTSIPAGSFSGAITFDTKVYDTANAFNGTRFTAPVAGIYNICASAIANAAPTNWEIDLYKNGSRDHAFMLSPSGTTVSGCTMTQLAAGDYVDIRTFQSNAQTIQVSNLWTWIAITKM